MRDVLDSLNYTKDIIPNEIEGSTFDGLLENGKDFKNYDIRRKWSFFKNIDCVEFVRNKLVKLGLAEFAVDYANFVFVFANDDNKKFFL